MTSRESGRDEKGVKEGNLIPFRPHLVVLLFLIGYLVTTGRYDRQSINVHYRHITIETTLEKLLTSSDHCYTNIKHTG